MSTPQQAKIDLIVNMAGASAGDAQKLLKTLEQVEKVEKEIAKAAEQHTKALEANRKAAQAATQRGLGVVGGALSGGPMGAMAAMGGTPGAIAGVVQSAEAGLNKLARAAEIAATANTTSAQRTRMIVDELVPFGSALNKLVDAISGTADAIFRRNQQFAINMGKIDLVARHDQQERRLSTEQAEAEVRRTHLDRNRPAAYRDHDRTTVGGQHAYQEQGITLPAQDAARAARVTAESARSMYNAEGAREARLRERLKELESNRAGLNRNLADQRQRENVFGGVRNEAGINAAAAAVQENERQIAAQTAAINEQILRTKEAGVKAAEAESRLRRSMIDVQKAELEVLKQREQRMAGIQQSLGSMSRGQFGASARAVEQVRRRGIANVSAQTAGLASQIAPEFVARQREALGGERAAQLRGRMGAEAFGQVYGSDFGPGSTLADTRRNIDRVQAEVRVAVQVDERALASEIIKNLEPTFQRFIDNVNAQIRSMENDIRAGAIRSSNSTNGSSGGR